MTEAPPVPERSASERRALFDRLAREREQRRLAWKEYDKPQFQRLVNESEISYLVTRLRMCRSEEEHRGVYHRIQEQIGLSLDQMFRGRWNAPPLFELYHRERLMWYDEKPEVDARLRRSEAMQRDITDLLHLHLAYRRKYGGNIVLEWTGPTGFGKSSCMLAFMERWNELDARITVDGPKALEARISVDIVDLIGKLEHLGRFDAVAMDEQFALSGEGSETQLKGLRNIEETIRQSQIDVHYASPSTRDHTSAQGMLEAIAWSPAQKESAFLYHLALSEEESLPLGMVRMPWASDVTWKAYAPFKTRNVERSKRAFFSAQRATPEFVRRVFESHDFLVRLEFKPEPTKSDLKRWLARIASSMSIAELGTLSDELDEMLEVLRKKPDIFQRMYGWTPTEGMITLGRKNRFAGEASRGNRRDPDGPGAGTPPDLPPPPPARKPERPHPGPAESEEE